MPVPDGWDNDARQYTGGRAEPAHHYQKSDGDYHWHCDDCASYKDKVEKILAWKPDPEGAPQPYYPPGQAPPPKTMLPRKYDADKQWRETLVFATSTAVVFTCVMENKTRVRGIVGGLLRTMLAA